MPPETRYATSGDVNIAYQVVGDGPSDLDQLSEAIRAFLGSIQHEQAAFDRLLATVLFTDIVDSTSQSAAMGDQAWGKVQDGHDLIVRAQLARFHGREIRKMGDGFLATFDGPGRAVRCAQAIVAAVPALGIEVRAGLHTGEIEVADGDVAGLAVAIGARVGALAGPSEVLVSSTVKDLVVGSGISFSELGACVLKGVPGEWRLYAVDAIEAPVSRKLVADEREQRFSFTSQERKPHADKPFEFSR